MSTRSLHVVMLSDYETAGGAAVAASRLAEALAARHRVTRCVLYPDGREHPWQTWPLIPGRPEQLSRWGRFFGEGPPPRTPQALLRRALDKLRPDVVNVHNIHSGVTSGWGPDLLTIAAEFAPVVWTLHDMWSFTGRCAYSYECQLFRAGCDARCGTSMEFPSLALADIAPAWQRRRELLDLHPGVVAVTPSQWLADEARSGLWHGHRLDVIRYGVPLDRFRPVPRQEARRALGIDSDRPVLLLAAQDLTERRKGGPLVPHLWECVSHRPLTVLTMGQGNLVIDDPGVRVVPLGWIDDVERQALIYSAADAVLHPAPVDNLPNVLLEALACGTPAIAFPIGGVPEIVRAGTTGWLAREVNAPSLAAAMNDALDDLRRGVDLRASCRAQAEREYAYAGQLGRYEELFATLTARRRHWGEALRKKIPEYIGMR